MSERTRRPGPPRDLRELRPLLVGGERLASAFAAICDATVLPPNARQAGEMPGPLPDFLLVEAGEEDESPWEGLDPLLDDCEASGVPSLLWIATDRLDRRWLERCARFDRVFTVDAGQLDQLEEAGAPMPSVLWPATALPIEEGAPPAEGDSPPPRAGDRPNPVLWLGGWRRDWPARWAERLTTVLRGAAGLGLRIVPVAELDGLPEDLRPCVAEGADDDAVAELRLAKLVVCADPVAGSETFPPAVVFDAAACGAAVVTPHRFANRYDFGVDLRDETPPIAAYDTGARSNPFWDLTPWVTDADSARRRIELLLRDDSLREESARCLSRIVRHNHTYRHRLATLASAVGRRLPPAGPS